MAHKRKPGSNKGIRDLKKKKKDKPLSTRDLDSVAGGMPKFGGPGGPHATDISFTPPSGDEVDDS